MKALILHHGDGTSYVSFVEEENFDLDEWITERLEGLCLLGIVRVELRDKKADRVAATGS